ncbi:MAG: sulfite exporter TauE/SafE family protein [Acetobacteraceae bacterium]
MTTDIALFAAIGFLAQLIDGAAGMAYGVTATTVLLSAGIAPATASAAVHAAEVFTTGASGAAHLWAGNVRRALVVRLALPGMIGGAGGAVVLASLPAAAVRPWVSAYLMVMGALILWRAARPAPQRAERLRFVPVLGLVGGFLDAIGGGGWGPIVTSTLIGSGTAPRYAIGSVNLAEFFVTVTISVTFLATIGLELWRVVVGLVIGGVIAAPVAAVVAKHVPTRALLVVVGVVVLLLSLRGLIVSLR